MDYEKLEYRALSTKDFWTVLKIVRSGGKEAFKRINEADSDEGRAMILIDVGLDHAEQDLKGLLANLAGEVDAKGNFKPLTVQQYDEGPFDLSLSILEKVQEKSDLAGFFKRAASFLKKFGS